MFEMLSDSDSWNYYLYLEPTSCKLTEVANFEIGIYKNRHDINHVHGVFSFISYFERYLF